MKYLVLFFCFYSFSQINEKKISFEYFYKKELNEIVLLKKQLKKEPNNFTKLIQLAEKYGDINCEDSSYATYFKVFELNKKLNALSQSNFFNLLEKLHLTETSKKNYTKSRGFFLNQLKKNVKSKLQLAKYNYILSKQYFLDSSDTKTAKIYLEKVKKNPVFSKNLLLQNQYYLILGNIFTSENNFEKSHEYLTKSLLISNKNNDFLHKIYSHINLGVNYKVQENWHKALYHFQIAENIPNNKYIPKILRIIYLNKLEVYYGLKDDDNYKNSDKIYIKLDSIINDFHKNSNFYEIDSRYQLADKNQQIKTLYQNKTLYLSLIFIVFLLALYSFLRWKKVDSKRKKISFEKENLKQEKENLELLKENLLLEKENLKIEHYQTLEQLEKVKQLVIEDHIILKNKAKIYLDELLYIKAEDHYLQLITTNKKEFVRGKLTEIQEQLPPNFVKCHRSYIINVNFIKQILTTSILMKNNEEIPNSRGFKM